MFIMFQLKNHTHSSLRLRDHTPQNPSRSKNITLESIHSTKLTKAQKYHTKVVHQDYIRKVLVVSFSPDVTIDERVRVALNQSRQILANQNLTYFSISQPTREYFTPKDNGLHFNLVPALNEDFEGKFWRVIKEAKL